MYCLVVVCSMWLASCPGTTFVPMRKVAAASMCTSEHQSGQRCEWQLPYTAISGQGCIPLELYAFQCSGCVGLMHQEASRAGI